MSDGLCAILGLFALTIGPIADNHELTTAFGLGLLMAPASKFLIYAYKRLRESK